MATSRENKVTTRHRNDRGAGTVFYNDKLNRWIVMVPMPKTFDGKRKRLKRSFETKTEAMKFLTTETTEEDPVELTVADLLNGWRNWLERRSETGLLAPKTLESYRNASTHLYAAFSSFLASEMTVDQVEQFLTVQMREHSGRYVVLQRNALDQAYRWAQRNRLLTWNPAQLSTCPAQLNYKQGTVLTAEQAQTLFQTTRGHRLHALWSVMLGVGLRPGEAMELTWDCIDLNSDPSVLHVRHYLRTGKDGVFLGQPKTAQSARSLDLPDFVVDALKSHAETSETRAEGAWRDLVFATSSGTPYAHRNLRRALKRVCANAGLPSLTLYDLRRTAGSLLVDAGVHLECVADLLGHSSVATTRRHYVRAVRPTVPHAKQMDSVVN
jgi:integrase